jgi:serine/threonine-protein kinase HipA
MRTLVGNADSAIESVHSRLPRGFPVRTWERIAQGMRAQARRFEAGAAALQEPTQ